MSSTSFANIKSESAGQRVTRIAKQNGWQRSRNGLWKAPGNRKLKFSMQSLSKGWLELSRTPPGKPPENLLAAHADWAGPVKLVAASGQVQQRIDLMLQSAGTSLAEPYLDEEAAAEADELIVRVLETMPRYFGRITSIDGWTPPPASLIAAWIHPNGHEVAIDKEQNLRLAIKRRGCDGQVRIERAAGRLRLIMPLGKWSGLEADAQQAVLRLAEAANNKCRLARIAWIEEEGSGRIEAQVDLSGLPCSEHPSRSEESLWKAMLQMALCSLELCLRRLGLELSCLAAGGNESLVKALLSAT